MAMLAGFVSFFRTVFLLLLFVLFFRWLSRLLFPVMHNKKGNRSSREYKRKEGDVTIEYKDRKDATKEVSGGEYVDFEEMKD